MTSRDPNPFEPPVSTRESPRPVRWRRLVEAAAGVAGSFVASAVAAFLTIEFAVNRALSSFTRTPAPNPFGELAYWIAPWAVWLMTIWLLRKRFTAMWRSGLAAGGLLVLIQVLDRLT